MPRWLLFGSASFSFVALAALGACNGDKVQTPTSDKNYDDGDDPGSGMVTVPPGDGGAVDARAREGGLDAASDAAVDAPADSPPDADAMTDSAADSATDAAPDAAAD